MAVVPTEWPGLYDVLSICGWPAKATKMASPGSTQPQTRIAASRWNTRWSWKRCGYLGSAEIVEAKRENDRRRHADGIRTWRILRWPTEFSRADSMTCLTSSRRKRRGFLRSRRSVRSLRCVPLTTALLRRRTTRRLYFWLIQA